MADILYLRARRFEALHDLLTGAACPEHPTRLREPEARSKTVGLPEGRRAAAPHWRRGIGLSDCCARAKQATPDRRPKQ